MNILIINQPFGNRGDESAHKALVRRLNKEFPSSKITVLAFYKRSAVREFMVNNSNNNYIYSKLNSNYGATKVATIFTQIAKPILGLHAHPELYKFKKAFKESDLVICAPGGICMGGFQNWVHLFMLQLARMYKKTVVYYSRSFGPFPTKTRYNRIFKRQSMQMLDYFGFLSIRDAKTMILANELNIPFVESIDTAFLEQPIVEIPKEIQSCMQREYAVFVPNSLSWHYAYKYNSKEDIDAFFMNIAKIILDQYPKFNLLLLPQLCSRGTDGDYHYFKKIAEQIGNERIIVISDKFGSDVQQAIIKDAKFVVGARYHSIVFAINNKTPFVSLSYEHKMNGLLELLKLEDNQLDISNLFKNGAVSEEDYSLFKDKLSSMSRPSEESKIAQTIALDCFKRLSDYIRAL